ncbi:MAG: PcfB family protein [Lachnospiraceae bacterium]|nr:PcfB family protein [Lachnospiraceae bacterium]
MQEEVENKTYNLMISTTKLSARTFFQALQRLNQYRQKKRSNFPKGKQSVKQLIGQNRGVSNIDISKTDIRGFQKYARKYGIDYAIKKDKKASPPKYLLFFKAGESDALTMAFKEYTDSVMKRQNRKRSVVKQLVQLKNVTMSIPKKIKNKTMGEHSL